MNAWRRLLSAGEVTELNVPTPPPLSEDPRARHYLASGSSRDEGAGLDYRRLIELRRPENINKDGLGAGQLAIGDPIGPAPDVLYATAYRTWWLAELPALEREAEAILLTHGFPATEGPENVVWTWDGETLTWADSSAVAPVKAELVHWDSFMIRPAYREHWPEWSPFDWAQRVWACRRLRLWAEREGRPDEAFRAGFDLGTFLGHWAGRQQYQAMVLRGGRPAPWMAPALQEAIRIRKINPSLGRGELAKKLKTSTALASEILPGLDQIKKKIKDWETSGELVRSSQNPTAPK